MRQDLRDSLILRWADYCSGRAFTHMGYMNMLEEFLTEYEETRRRERRDLIMKLMLTAVVLSAAGGLLTILWWVP